MTELKKQENKSYRKLKDTQGGEIKVIRKSLSKQSIMRRARISQNLY